MSIKNRTRKKITLIVFIFTVLLVFLQFFLLFLENSNRLLSRGEYKQFENYKAAYYSSQYANPNATGFVPDEIFEMFAAGAFLRGANPIMIVHDHPPLGRYILSFSLLLFDNSSTIVVICLIASYIGIYMTARLILKNSFLSLIPLAVFVNEPLNLNKLIYTPLPEPVQLPFIIFMIYFFLLSIKKKDKRIYYILVGILLGFVISIRFFVTGGVITFSMLIFILITKKNIKDALYFLSFLSLSVIVLVLSYTQTLRAGYSFIDLVGIQKYILNYHKSAFTNMFSIWDLILFNKWHTWWGERLILSDPHWNVFWPASVVLTGLSLFFSLLKKFTLTKEEMFLMIFVLSYMMMLSVGYTSTRYFLPLLPYLYILAVSFSIRLLKILIKNVKTN